MTSREPRADRPDTDDALLQGGAVPDELGPVAAVLADLRELISLPAPAPTAELERLLAAHPPVGGLVIDLAGRRASRALRVGATLALATVTALGSVGVAAAHGSLPHAAQDAVADAVTALTPFAVPHPERPSRLRVRPEESAAHPPAVVETAAPSRDVRPRRVAPVPAPSARPAKIGDGPPEGSPTVPDGTHGTRGRDAVDDASRPSHGSSSSGARQPAAGPDQGDIHRNGSDPEPEATGESNSVRESEPASTVSGAQGPGDGGSTAIPATAPAPDADLSGNTGSGSGDAGGHGDPASPPSGEGGTGH